MRSWGGQPLPALSCRKYRRLLLITNNQPRAERDEKRVSKMRDPYNIPLDEIAITEWREQAQCLGRDPREYELESMEHNKTDRQATARNLCDGCSVMQECAAEALEPLAKGTVRGGVWIPSAMPRGISARVHEALIEIALGEALPDDLTELLTPVQGESKRLLSTPPSMASAHASLTPVGDPPRNRANHAPPAPVPARRGVPARG